MGDEFRNQDDQEDDLDGGYGVHPYAETTSVTVSVETTSVMASVKTAILREESLHDLIHSLIAQCVFGRKEEILRHPELASMPRGSFGSFACYLSSRMAAEQVAEYARILALWLNETINADWASFGDLINLRVVELYQEWLMRAESAIK